MTITVDNKSGFCFGVIRAIEKAEQALANGIKLYSLGEIVHNNAEVSRLKAKGLSVILPAELEQLADVTVLIRAHGEPPTTYATAAQNNVQIVDATCPVVLQMQRKIKQCYENKNANTQLLIFGQKGHAEVNGLVGQASGDAQVVETIGDISDWTRSIILFSQTTKSVDDFNKLCADIRLRLPNHLHFEAHNTICRHVSQRVQHLQEFAAQHDVIIFVSGALSSNGNVLFEICKSVNAHTHRVERAEDLQASWFAQCRSVGVCGATSTPQWLMEQVADAVREIGGEQ
ncbi:4-hydroxy-3-methylbut-2-enyl diphosphate reductase [Bacteroidia bacterium]|nr:4-hydroxy-3-methylbut-2-enyl diphosphate reductase [Bacteroidia bacterium]